MEKPGSVDLTNILLSMNPISLDEMDHVKLMHRRDTKFVLPFAKVRGLIQQASEHYRILEIDGERLHAYHTVYYDTPVLEMYQKHHGGRLNRYKIRVRKYVTSNTSFLEVKFKNSKRETIKKRVKHDSSEGINSSKAELFLKENSPYYSKAIKPSLENFFTRITLVHKTLPERITIDLDLSFRTIEGDKTLNLPYLSVIEVKRDRDSEKSDMIKLLRINHIQAMGFSKYCMGTAMINPNVKRNLFRNRIRKIEKYETLVY